MIDKYFKHYNPNPLNLETGDCVIRSLCVVTGLTWYEVFDKCCNIARMHATLPNSSDIINQRCKEFNLQPRKIPRPKKGEKSLNVQEFCKLFKKGKYIVSTAHHNIGVVDGKYYDLYPNYGQKVYKYYELID